MNILLIRKEIVVLKSLVPDEEFIIVNLDQRVVHIDGNMTIPW